MEYKHGAHTFFTTYLHLVWTTKYWKRVLVGEVDRNFRVEGEDRE